MIRCAHDDRVEIFQFQQFVVVLELFGLSADLVGGEIKIRLIKIADGHNFSVGMFKKGVEYLIASMTLGAGFIYCAARLLRGADRRWALRTYLFSLAYLALLFLSMPLDRLF